MLQGFNSLADHIAMAGASQTNDAFDDATVIGIAQDVTNEALVDLQQVHRQLAQISQR